MAGAIFDWRVLKDYIGLESTENDEFILQCFNNAQLMITDVIADAFREVPESILKQMILEVGQGLYNRKDEPAGTSNMISYEGGATPVRTSRDALYMIRPILAMYVVQF